ncbi:class I SAM-dependent DNA methyltransferase [Streptomyces sp. NPDC014006]|uniref:class I SAM-dependent DNA methyltransferase n=1 Tax=Streptomyces sp. NPDC014006 TaxID=3364870 RepID=UPI0036F79516
MTDSTTTFLTDTRAAYDAIAPAFAEAFPDILTDLPLERALLSAFAEQVTAHGPEPVADVGSGPGHVTARLHSLGVPVFGIDISPRMAALAREAHPDLRFHVGSMTALDVPDATLGGLLALYSVIHVPDEHLPTVFAEFRRVLVPGGQLLLSFQMADPAADGTEHLHLSERFGQAIALDYYWRTPQAVAAVLTEAGLTLQARVVREPLGPEKRPRAFLLARKPE